VEALRVARGWPGPLPTALPSSPPDTLPSSPAIALSSSLPVTLHFSAPVALPYSLPVSLHFSAPVTLPSSLPVALYFSHPTALPSSPFALPYSSPIALPFTSHIALPSSLPNLLPSPQHIFSRGTSRNCLLPPVKHNVPIIAASSPSLCFRCKVTWTFPLLFCTAQLQQYKQTTAQNEEDNELHLNAPVTRDT
jgi:hypothetical protein